MNKDDLVAAGQIVGSNSARPRFPGWPKFDEDEVEAATAVLRSGKVNYWTGSEGRLFEREFGDLLGVPHSIALANGTIALEFALAALGVGPGDEVITSPRTFIASASCAVTRGASPVFADVSRESQNITAESIERVWTRKTRAVIVVHLAGWPCDMGPIIDLARSRSAFVIEDCAQALGATYKTQPVGTLGEVGAFSFCQDKILTTGGEGGMLVTRDQQLWSRMWSMKDHGKSYAEAHRTDHPPGFRWLHESFGTNGRMTEMQAAIGRVQLSKLDRWIDRRRTHAARLHAQLREIDALRIPVPGPELRHAYYKFYAFLDLDRLKAGWSRERVVGAIANLGVPCYSGSCSEVYLERAFDGTASRPANRLPVAKELGESSLMFLVHPTLQDEHIDRVAAAVRMVLDVALK